MESFVVANSTSGESVITRVVRILSVFTEFSRPLTVREVAKESALPVSTAYRLLGELETEDLVARDAEGRWHHGTRLWEIASKGSRVQPLREAALPAMERIVSKLKVHVSLAILDRNEVLYLERLTPNEYTVNITEIAGRLPSHATSAGLALIAFGTDEQAGLLLRRTLPKYTDMTPVTRDELRHLLARTRRDGFAVMAGAITPESTGISVPVFGSTSIAVASMTIIVPRGSENLEEQVPVLQSAAREIQRRLSKAPFAISGPSIEEHGPGIG